MARTEKEYIVPSKLKREYERGKALCESGEPERARIILFKLLSEEPHHPIFWNGLGNTYRLAQDYVNAEKVYLRAIEIAPDFTIAYANLCAVYSFMGDNHKALRYADLAIELRPRDALTWHTLGLFYVGIGDKGTALEYFLAAYSIDNDFHTAAFNIACMYGVIGKPTEALPYLEASLVDLHTIGNALKDADLADVRCQPEFDGIILEAVKRLRETGEEIPDGFVYALATDDYDRQAH